MIKEINFDMDGTLVDFYGVENWLEDLNNNSIRPYKIARPLVNMSDLARTINKLQSIGYKVNIITWLSKNCDSNVYYGKRIIKAKKDWLAKHLPSVKFDNMTFMLYGENKHEVGKGILFDDNADVRKAWGENAYDVNNIMEELKALL